LAVAQPRRLIICYFTVLSLLGLVFESVFLCITGEQPAFCASISCFILLQSASFRHVDTLFQFYLSLMTLFEAAAAELLFIDGLHGAVIAGAAGSSVASASVYLKAPKSRAGIAQYFRHSFRHFSCFISALRGDTRSRGADSRYYCINSISRHAEGCHHARPLPFQFSA